MRDGAVRRGRWGGAAGEGRRTSLYHLKLYISLFHLYIFSFVYVMCATNKFYSRCWCMPSVAWYKWLLPDSLKIAQKTLICSQSRSTFTVYRALCAVTLSLASSLPLHSSRETRVRCCHSLKERQSLCSTAVPMIRT